MTDAERIAILEAALRAMTENFTAERQENLRLAALLAALLRGDMVEGEA